MELGSLTDVSDEPPHAGEYLIDIVDPGAFVLVSAGDAPFRVIIYP